MMAILSLLGVACVTASTLMLTGGEIGVLQIVFAALFGFGAFICACVVAIMAMARHAKNKVVGKVQNFKFWWKRLD